jgi:hypothetical protein
MIAEEFYGGASGPASLLASGGGEFLGLTSQATFSREGKVKTCNPVGDNIDHLLPDARTLKDGHMFYILNVDASFTIDVGDFDDSLVVNIPAGEWAKVFCYDRSTAAGQWMVALSTGSGLKIPS